MARLRSEVVKLANSWVGLKESDGSYKKILDIYNSHKPLPRGVKMQPGWAWCACTWSALAIKLGYTDIMPIEISCGELIILARKMGIWVEKDAYVPKPGDAILYDWDDNGRGDCLGAPEHIGVVTDVDTVRKTFTVVEGNYSRSVKRRTMQIDGRYIRGFITPKYFDEDIKVIPEKTIEQVAKEIIAGKWNNGDVRKKKLAEAGYDPTEVQNEVNRLLREG